MAQNKRIFLVTKLGVYQSTQFMHLAEDLHELCVDILQLVPPRASGDYSDAEVVNIMTRRDTWENGSYFLIGEYHPSTQGFRELVKDSDG